MICPTCGADTLITDTRPHAQGWRRRRKCSNDHRFTTLELVVVDEPRRIEGLSVKAIDLDKAKLMARVAAVLDESL